MRCLAISTARGVSVIDALPAAASGAGAGGATASAGAAGAGWAVVVGVGCIAAQPPSSAFFAACFLR
jgi:hypothetical protein